MENPLIIYGRLFGDLQKTIWSSIEDFLVIYRRPFCRLQKTLWPSYERPLSVLIEHPSSYLRIEDPSVFLQKTLWSSYRRPFGLLIEDPLVFLYILMEDPFVSYYFSCRRHFGPRMEDPLVVLQRTLQYFYRRTVGGLIEDALVFLYNLMADPLVIYKKPLGLHIEHTSVFLQNIISSFNRRAFDFLQQTLWSLEDPSYRKNPLVEEPFDF